MICKTFSETMDKLGLKPIIKVLESLGLPSFPTYLNVTDDMDYESYTFDWLEAVIKIKINLGMDVLIGFDIFTDPKNSSTYRLVMGSPETTNPFPRFVYAINYKYKYHKNFFQDWISISLIMKKNELYFIIAFHVILVGPTLC